ncbi:MAG: TrmB family transcriptional regulator [Salinirussus sp.]
MDDTDAIAGLERLGLTSYEARVFVALQKLGTGTASEIADVAEVPRSQVYGAAERLEERGLVETRQSTPTAYRPVSLEQARTALLEDLQSTGARTFEYLDSIAEADRSEEEAEEIWLVEGAAPVASRLVDLIEGAERTALYGVDDVAMFEQPVRVALAEAADRGVDVAVGSNDAEMLEAAGDIEGVSTVRVPDDRSPDVSIGRLFVADDRTMLLSVLTSPEVAGESAEVAFWSADSTFAAVLVEFIEEWFLEPFDGESNA